MDENYEYLSSKNRDELIEIIDGFWDMDETIEALFVLQDLDEAVVVEKGLHFLQNNEGDEYFQAMIVDLLTKYIDDTVVFDCLINRNVEIQSYLLGDLLRIMSMTEPNEKLIDYANIFYQKYLACTDEEKNRIKEEYNDFIELYMSFIKK